MDENMELQRETIITSGQYIKKVISGIDIINGIFKSGDTEKGLANCAALVDGLEWLAEAVSLTKDVLDEHNGNFNEVQLRLVAKSLSEALDNKDSELLISLMENQLKPLMIQWDGKFDEIVKNSFFA